MTKYFVLNKTLNMKRKTLLNKQQQSCSSEYCNPRGGKQLEEAATSEHLVKQKDTIFDNGLNWCLELNSWTDFWLLAAQTLTIKGRDQICN